MELILASLEKHVLMENACQVQKVGEKLDDFTGIIILFNLAAFKV